MNPASQIDVLNRLYVLHNRSLPMYLHYATPWAQNGQAASLEVLKRIAHDQKSLRDRIGEMIIDIDGAVRHGVFPLSFTSLHDLSFEYLLGRLIADQRKLVAEIEKCVRQLDQAPMAQALAEEALGYARGHLDMLEELANPKAGPKLAGSTVEGAPADADAPAASHRSEHGQPTH